MSNVCNPNRLLWDTILLFNLKRTSKFKQLLVSTFNETKTKILFKTNAWKLRPKQLIPIRILK